jgi:hypothetical protein
MAREIKLTSRLFIDHGRDIEKILQLAVREALIMHKRIGNPIATWKDGKVIIVPPEEIEIPPNPFADQAEAKP